MEVTMSQANKTFFSNVKMRFLEAGYRFITSLVLIVGANASDKDKYNDNKHHIPPPTQTRAFVKNSEMENVATLNLAPLSQILSKTRGDWFNWEEMEAKDKEQQTAWLQQQSLFEGYNTTGDASLVTDALSQLGLNEKPLAFGQREYIEDQNGLTTFMHYKHQTDSFQVKDYGLSATKLSYVAEDNTQHRETFTPTLPKGRTYKAGRKHPFPAFSLMVKGENIDFDAGHGIDQADTVLANGRNSSTDPSNFIPQNRYYNQKIRNHIVNHEVRKQIAGSYKEIDVYDDTEPLFYTFPNGKKCNIPIGFLFIIFSNHQVARTFYFPNLISYEKLIAAQHITLGYRSFMDYFEISQTAVVNEAIKIGETDKHTRIVNGHEEKGYRSLSGRFDIVGHIEMPNPAKAALRRLIAIYHMEKAAHLEFRCVENKAQLVDIFTRRMKYYALDKATEQEEVERQRAYWQVYEDEEQNLAKDGNVVDMVSYAISFENLNLRLRGLIPENDPRELALKRIQNRHKELERGQSLYYPERAKQWLTRVEESVRQSPNIEDIIRLLGLYDIPEVQSLDKKRAFEALLEERGNEASLEEQKDIGDYFYYQLENTDRGTEIASLQVKVDSWKAIVEKRIDESTSIEDLTQAAEWYHGGRGMFDQDFDRAREIYQTLFPAVDSTEKERIKRCLKQLDKVVSMRARV